MAYKSVLQIPADIKPSTKIVGIFGDPIAHTLSPKMHSYAFKKLDLDYVYLPFHVKPDQLKDAVDELRSNPKIVGVNVTIPHKESIFSLIPKRNIGAETIGAINTVIKGTNGLIGDNTDGAGFLTSLREDGKFIPDQTHTAVIWGSGGAARAIACSLLSTSVKKIILLNRTPERAKKLKDFLLGKAPKTELLALDLNDPKLTSAIKCCSIFINTTPAGIEGFPVKPEEFITPKTFIYDAVYAKSTSFMDAAERAGAPHLGGLGMLIHQGALSFALWTGKEPPVNLMKESFNA